MITESPDIKKGKILGTSDPAATTNTNLFTAQTPAVRIATLTACNRSASAVDIRIGIDEGGGGTNSPTDAEWLVYDLEVPANSTWVFDPSRGLWLSIDDDVVVYASASDMSFIATGLEIG